MGWASGGGGKGRGYITSSSRARPSSPWTPSAPRPSSPSRCGAVRVRRGEGFAAAAGPRPSFFAPRRHYCTPPRGHREPGPWVHSAAPLQTIRGDVNAAAPANPFPHNRTLRNFGRGCPFPSPRCCAFGGRRRPVWRWRAHARAGAHAGSRLGGRGMRQPVGRASKSSHSRLMIF